jgi:hypothetical protein
LKGVLKLEIEPLGSTPADYVIFHFNPATGAKEQIALPFQMNIEEPGHVGGGVHVWHAGYEQFSIRRIGDGALTLKATIVPDEGASFKTAKLHLLPVEFNIFSGQNAAQMVPEDKKETVGAFTVANLNDTDGDTTIDNVDNTVKAAAGATGNSDEVDLMKLEIKGPSTGRMKVTVVSGTVKFWDKKTKETAVPLTSGAIFINSSDLPKTLWVEATAVSGSVRDIYLKLGYELTVGGALVDDIDRVKATAVWATNTELRNLSSQTLWSEVNDPLIINNWNLNYGGGPFGIHYDNAPVGIGYTIGFQFTVLPTGIGNENMVKFDVTRQLEGKIWTLNRILIPIAVQLEFDESFPSGDLANDNVNIGPDRDNDNTPTNDHLYSIDSPGRPTRVSDAAEYIFRVNFREYVRVQFNGQQPTGNVLAGSRCSAKKDWRCRISARNVNGFYQQNSSKPNDVTAGHVAIPNQP